MNFTRYLNRKRFKVIFFLFIFLIYYEILKYERSEFSSGYGFSTNDVQNALDDYTRLKNEYQVTGIVLHWQRLNGVQRLVQTMLDFDDIFVNIIIWNNNPKKNLTLQDLSIKNTSRIEIINSNKNIKDQAKYRACGLAKTKACFYADDDWDIRFYVRSLYSNFLLEPAILHAITDQFTYYTNLMWSFFDSSIDLHTGFSWIGCGSIFSRENAIRHLKLLDYFLDSDANRDLLPQGDQFFSIWMNQLPAQFNGRMLHSDEGAASSFENYDFEMIQYRASVLSIQVLEKTLRNSPESTLFVRNRSSNSLVTYTKSPCSYNNKFIFFTNCLPIDHLEEIPFNITTDITRGTRRNLPNMPRSIYTPGMRFYGEYNTAHVVDNNNETCWKINRTIRYGDLYGMDFHTIQTDSNLSFSMTYFHDASLQKRLQISISLDSYKWTNLPKHHQQGIIYEREKNLVSFYSELFPESFRIFRFIKFMSLTDENSSFHICEVHLIPSRNKIL